MVAAATLSRDYEAVTGKIDGGSSVLLSCLSCPRLASSTQARRVKGKSRSKIQIHRRAIDPKSMTSLVGDLNDSSWISVDFAKSLDEDEEEEDNGYILPSIEDTVLAVEDLEGTVNETNLIPRQPTLTLQHYTSWSWRRIELFKECADSYLRTTGASLNQSPRPLWNDSARFYKPTDARSPSPPSPSMAPPSHCTMQRRLASEA